MIVKAYPSPENDLNPYLREGARILNEGGSLESGRAHLRNSGLWVSDSITVTAELTGNSRREIKQLIYSSKTWREMRPRIDEFHTMIESGLSELEKTGDIAIKNSTRSTA